MSKMKSWDPYPCTLNADPIYIYIYCHNIVKSCSDSTIEWFALRKYIDTPRIWRWPQRGHRQFGTRTHTLHMNIPTLTPKHPNVKFYTWTIPGPSKSGFLGDAPNHFYQDPPVGIDPMARPLCDASSDAARGKKWVQVARTRYEGNPQCPPGKESSRIWVNGYVFY